MHDYFLYANSAVFFPLPPLLQAPPPPSLLPAEPGLCHRPTAHPSHAGSQAFCLFIENKHLCALYRSGSRAVGQGAKLGGRATVAGGVGRGSGQGGQLLQSCDPARSLGAAPSPSPTAASLRESRG